MRRKQTSSSSSSSGSVMKAGRNIESSGVDKKPWLCILSSVYIAPYFCAHGKKSEGFLTALASKIHQSRFDSYDSKPIRVPPWYADDFSEVFIGFTDALHRYNDQAVLKKLLDYQIKYILERETQNESNISDRQPLEKEIVIKQPASSYSKTLEAHRKNLKKSASMLDNIQSKANSELEGNDKKGTRLFRGYWVQCFEKIFFGRENDIAKALDIHGLSASNKQPQGTKQPHQALRKLADTAIEKYKKKAESWGSSLHKKLNEIGKESIEIHHQGWNDFRKIDHSYQKAREIFEGWWRQNALGIRNTIIDYCSRYSTGRYDKNLERIQDSNNYPSALSALPSALFVCEEIVSLFAKVLRDGPGVIIYPTPNLGAKKSNMGTPFTIAKKLMQSDPSVKKIMQERHKIDPNVPYLQYTHPNDKIIMKINVESAMGSADPKNTKSPESPNLHKKVKLLTDEFRCYRQEQNHQVKFLQTLILTQQKQLQCQMIYLITQ